ncbi:MAG: alanine racemase, partial [Firmicutes bacterium]|nr:alanine racemase [Bacillota bacterium]
VARLPGLEVEGIFTHFAAADERDKEFTRRQLAVFLDLLERLRKRGLEVPLRHAANSAALIDLPETHLDLVRPGISLYGLYPSEEVDRSRLTLHPAMTFKTVVAGVKRVPAGFTVSYGCTYVTPRPAVIATIPAGYADGYTRLLSSRGWVLIHGRRARVVGRVCMDMFMVDVSHIPDVAVGDEVVLFGRQGGAELPVEEVAGTIGTINYEVVCMVSARVPRVYLRESGV